MHTPLSRLAVPDCSSDPCSCSSGMVARRNPPWPTAWQYMGQVTKQLQRLWRVGHVTEGSRTAQQERARFIANINARHDLLPALKRLHKPARAIRGPNGATPSLAQYRSNPGSYIAAMLDRTVAAVVQPKWRTHIDSGYGWPANGPAHGWNDFTALCVK